MTDVRTHIVWICAGCDDCEPQDGSAPADYPCVDSPSLNGALVVEAEPVADLLELLLRRDSPAYIEVDARIEALLTALRPS